MLIPVDAMLSGTSKLLFFIRLRNCPHVLRQCLDGPRSRTVLLLTNGYSPALPAR